MLVLSRQRDETIMIGDDIEITVVDIRGDKVRLGINAPTRIAVHRKEVYEAIRRENEQASAMPLPDVASLPRAAGAESASHVAGSAVPGANGANGSNGTGRPHASRTGPTTHTSSNTPSPGRSAQQAMSITGPSGAAGLSGPARLAAGIAPVPRPRDAGSAPDASQERRS
jgi:carbon storage regulator